MNTTETTNEEVQPPPVITPDLNAPIFFIEDKRGQDNEAIRNSRMKLTGDMDLISHFGLYYLYEMSKNKKVDENSDYQSYINDLPIKDIARNNKLRDLVMAPPTQKIPIIPFDQETLDSAYTLKVGNFPDKESGLDTSFFSNRKEKLDAQKKAEEAKQESDALDDSKKSKVTLKINMSYNEHEKPKKKRSYTTMDPEESEKLKKKHKKKKYKMDEYPSNI